MTTEADLEKDTSPATVGLVQKLLTGFAKIVNKGIDDKQAPLLARIKVLEEKQHALESVERRLSRHADHLARLESRVKTLEH